MEERIKSRSRSSDRSSSWKIGLKIDPHETRRELDGKVSEEEEEGGFFVLPAEKTEDGGFFVLSAPKIESGGSFALRNRNIGESSPYIRRTPQTFEEVASLLPFDLRTILGCRRSKKGDSISDLRGRRSKIEDGVGSSFFGFGDRR